MGFTGRWTSSTGIASVATHTSPAAVREISSPLGTLFLYGQCLATDTEVATTCTSMAHSREPAPAAHWPGCYSTAFITRSGITLLTDPTGQFPLFVAEKAGEVWFGGLSTDIATTTGATLDRISLATAVAAPEVGELSEGRSMYAGIRRIPDGRLLTIDSAGVRERECHVLRAAEDVDFVESAERLRLSLTAAVRARTTFSGLTFDLSGGIDSTSLALLASKDLDHLRVLTFVNPDAPVTDDLEHARHHSRLAGGLHQELVRADPGHLPYQTLGPTVEFPHGSLVATGALRARLRRAADLGSKVHVVGEGGDVVLAAPQAYLADVARQGDMVRLWRDCVAWGRLRARSPGTVFRGAVLAGGTTRRRALRQLATMIRTGRPNRPETWERNRIAHLPQPWPHWLTPTARQSLAEHVLAVADRQATTSGVGVGDAVTMEWVRQQALTLNTARAVGAEYGIDVHAPFMDVDVVRACVSLPAHRRADPRIPKPLLRAALSGLVPDAVLTRTTKGDYTRDAHLGVRRAATALRRILAEPFAADLGILEPGPVREVLDGAIQGLATPWGALNQVFAVEAWLREREKGDRP